MSYGLMSREDLFDFICQKSENVNTETLEKAQRYLDHLLEPIVYEVKRFCDSYYEGKKRNDPDFNCDKARFNLLTVQSVMHEVLTRINKENKNEMGSN